MRDKKYFEERHKFAYDLFKNNKYFKKVRAIIFDGDKICLHKLNFLDGRPFIYNFPGGGVENDENPKEAAKRESFEEFGAEVKIVGFCGSRYYKVPMEYAGEKFDSKRVEHFYICKAVHIDESHFGLEGEFNFDDRTFEKVRVPFSEFVKIDYKNKFYNMSDKLFGKIVAKLDENINKSNNKKPTKVADKEELLLVLDENGKSTGKLELRSVVHDKELWHNEVALWIINPKTKQVLLQRRSPNKRINPNKLGICAGHVVENDGIEETLKTEAKEELGLDITKFELHPLMVTKKKGKNNFHFTHNYYIFAEIPLSKFTLQKEELTKLLYVDYEKLKQMTKSENNETVFKFESSKDMFEMLDRIIKN